MTKILSCAAVLGLLVASSSSVLARGPGVQSGGASHFTPAFESNQPAGHTTLTPVPGLSGPKAFAPGQQMRNDMPPPAGVTAPAHGASVWTPGFLK
jgi:hypothetical protein